MLPLFIEWLMNNIILVEIMAYSIDNAYSIFESMNDRGLNLNPTEILKAYLLSKMSDDVKSEEMNDFWKERISSLKKLAGSDADESFFRAWFRAKFAQTSRKPGVGSENEDYEKIGTQFHAWLKANQKEIGLKQPQDFYLFVKSDFDFFSDVFMRFVFYQGDSELEESRPFFINATYPLADSVYQPLMLSSINKKDLPDIVYEKLTIVNRFVDIYINRRTLQDKSITQSTIRNWMFNVTKNIRNLDVDPLRKELARTLWENFYEGDGVFIFPYVSTFYAHYFYSRILYYLGLYEDFRYLLKSRKIDSMVLVQIFDENEFPLLFTDYVHYEERRLTNYCLIHRSEVEEFRELEPEDKIHWLLSQGRLPEMTGVDLNYSLRDFMEERGNRLAKLIDEVWPLYF